jgi:hypothetical protein
MPCKDPAPSELLGRGHIIALRPAINSLFAGSHSGFRGAAIIKSGEDDRSLLTAAWPYDEKVKKAPKDDPPVIRISTNSVDISVDKLCENVSKPRKSYDENSLLIF